MSMGVKKLPTKRVTVKIFCSRILKWRIRNNKIKAVNKKEGEEMPLSYEHQISLLKDILSNQQMDCCGSIAEYEQVGRIVKSLMVNTNINDQVKNLLTDIYDYSHNGISSKDLEGHITSNQDNLTYWVNEINQLSN